MMMMLLSPANAMQSNLLGLASFHPVHTIVDSVSLACSTKQPAGSTLIVAENRLASSFFPEKAVVFQFQKRTTVSLVRTSSTMTTRGFSSSVAAS
jgi:hypothetical protein